MTEVRFAKTHNPFSDWPQMHVAAVDGSLTVKTKLIDSCEGFCQNDEEKYANCDGNSLKCGVCGCGDTGDQCKAEGKTAICHGIGKCVCGNCHVNIYTVCITDNHFFLRL